jgi:hypothetical protein
LQVSLNDKEAGMFVRSVESDQPSIVVPEGETFTLSAEHAREYPNLMINLRPRSTAALLVAAGRPPSKSTRLSDSGAFERVDKLEGLVNLHERDDEERVAGYSVPFLSRIFKALDPEIRTPPQMVHLPTKTEPSAENPCGCHEHDSQTVSSERAYAVQQTRERDYQNMIATPVPEFLIELQVHILTHFLADIIVASKATLVLDDSVNFMLVRNILCYRGSRIVQKSSRLNVDITGTLRGGIPEYASFFTSVEVLKIHMLELQRITPDKP